MQTLVTGATGFIGSRLVERLIHEGVRVRTLVRRDLIAGRPFDQRGERVRGDVTEPDTLHKAVAGCDVIFHCAWGGDSLEEGRRINVQGTCNILMAAANAGVRRVVHLSSMAVHGYQLPSFLTEEYPLQFCGDAYGVSKAEGEKAALELGALHGVEVIILRPTLVYGPRSPIWLLGYFNRVKYERLALIDGGAKLVNLVYVDDLIDAMWIAVKKPGVAGQAFLISGAHPVSWHDYIGHFAQMCRKPMPPSVPLWWARFEVQWSRVYSVLTQHPRRLLGMDLSLMAQSTTVSIDKARSLLGYTPHFSLDEGMQYSEVWLRQEGHLPPAAVSKENVSLAERNGRV